MMTPISEISALLRNGKSVRQSSAAGGLPITRIETIADWSVNPERVGFADLTEADCRGWLLETGDILISHINSTSHLGKCAIYQGIPERLVHGMNLLVLRVNQEVAYPIFVYQMLASPQFRTQLPQITKNSVNQSSFNISNFKKLEIPLPPLTEQKRIAGILDAADALRAKRRAALAELDALLQSTFLEMFGDPVTNPMGWRECLIHDVAELGTGSTPSRKNDLYFQGNIPWVKSTEVDWGIVTRTSECVSVAGQKAARLKTYPKGSIILALYGQGKTRGKCAILGLDATINQACCALLPKPGCSTRYLFAFLKHSYSRLRGESRGGNQENLNLSIVREFPVPLPPIELQTRFAASVESIERQKVRMSAHLAELDALFASLQSRAFNGEL